MLKSPTLKEFSVRKLNLNGILKKKYLIYIYIYILIIEKTKTKIQKNET